MLLIFKLMKLINGQNLIEKKFIDNNEIDLSIIPTLFVFYNSYIITSIKELYFMVIKEVINSYKNGDIFFYWNDKIIKKKQNKKLMNGY